MYTLISSENNSYKEILKYVWINMMQYINYKEAINLECNSVASGITLICKKEQSVRHHRRKK